MLLSGLSPVETCDRWRTLDVDDFAIARSHRAVRRGPGDLLALGDADGMGREVFPHLGIDVGKGPGGHGNGGDLQRV